MMKLFCRNKTTADDAKLRAILKEHDPIEPLAGGALIALEAAILAQTHEQMRGLVPASTWRFPEFFQQGWTARAAAFASVVIVALGFIVGQATSGEATEPLLAGNLSLVAFADETSGQSLPVTDTSWGENDDNAE